MKYLTQLLAHDKLKHFFVGFFAYLFLAAILYDHYALIAMVFIAVVFEFYQKKTCNGQFEILDMVYGIVPGLMLYLVSVI